MKEERKRDGGLEGGVKKDAISETGLSCYCSFSQRNKTAGTANVFWLMNY